jgi:hypothetical protein
MLTYIGQEYYMSSFAKKNTSIYEQINVRSSGQFEKQICK